MNHPIATLRELYAQLELGEFDAVEVQLKQRLEHHDRYRTNAHPVDAELEQEILSRWSDYATRYGYVPELAAKN